MITIYWRDGELVITDPTTPAGKQSIFEKEMTYVHKSMVSDPKRPWIKETVKETVPLTNEVPGQAVKTLVAYQGFMDWAADLCRQYNLKYQIVDQRAPFPKPQMQLTKNHWHTQFSTLLKLLTANRSGILKCPTRWGKSSTICNTMRAFPGVPTVLTAPGADLLGQAVDELRAALPERTITSIFSGSKGKKGQCDDITVCSMDSLEKLNPESVRLLLVDEPHALVSETRLVQASKFKNARILGFGATVDGRFDGADALLTGLIGPVIVEKTFREAVKDKAICDITVYMVRVPFEPFGCGDRNRAYKELMFENEQFDALVQRISSEVVPADWQTLIFADTVKQIHLLNTFVESGVPAIASQMTGKERKQRFADMKSGEIKRCLCTNIYSQGVTFPDLRCIINASGGGGSITGTQKPGRLAQRRPGKTSGHLIDFLFVPKGWEDEERVRTNDKWFYVVNDCQSRMKVYRANGYNVKIVNDVSEIKLT